MPSYAKTIIATLALSTAAATAYNPYADPNSIYARDAEPDYEDYDLFARDADADADADAEPEDDHLSHVYSRDPESRHLQIRDDIYALHRVRELAARDPDLFDLYVRDPEAGWKKGAAVGAGVGLLAGGPVGAAVGGAIGAGVQKVGHKLKEKWHNHKAKKEGKQGGGMHEGAMSEGGEEERQPMRRDAFPEFDYYDELY